MSDLLSGKLYDGFVAQTRADLQDETGGGSFV